jgi:hypothetical protein
MNRLPARTVQTRVVAAAFGCGLAGLLSADAATGAGAPGAAPDMQVRPEWTEVRWPFLIDEWGTGRAFRCGASRCGVEVNVYLRPKIGFCNCSTGVSDDMELDRVGDLHLLNDRYVPRGEGEPFRAGTMNGRSRAYDVENPYGPRWSALGVAFNEKCSVMVATVAAARDLPPAAARAALDFLAGPMIVGYSEASLDQPTQ